MQWHSSLPLEHQVVIRVKPPEAATSFLQLDSDSSKHVRLIHVYFFVLCKSHKADYSSKDYFVKVECRYISPFALSQSGSNKIRIDTRSRGRSKAKGKADKKNSDNAQHSWEFTFPLVRNS